MGPSGLEDRDAAFKAVGFSHHISPPQLSPTGDRQVDLGLTVEHGVDLVKDPVVVIELQPHKILHHLIGVCRGSVSKGVG